jgi:uncharacterized SAM-binding protein YcdF (DUF218 family)
MAGFADEHTRLVFGAPVRGPVLMRLLLVLLAGLALLWLGGFIAFVHGVARQRPPHAPHADGIVVLTGGAARLNVAIDLLERGEAKRLLITGVHPETGAQALSDVTIGSKALFDCCVDLGKSAMNTRGNAREAAGWAEARAYRTLIIVTANYHMPRSLLEFRAAMPDTELIAYPVLPPDLKLYHWWRHPGTASLLASEYSKYLLSLARLWPATAPQLALSGAPGPGRA